MVVRGILIMVKQKSKSTITQEATRIQRVAKEDGWYLISRHLK